MGPNSFDSRSNCEPTRLAREPSSGAPLGVAAGSPLYLRVQKPGGTGELEPMISSGAGTPASPACRPPRGRPMRKALNENPMVQLAVLGVCAVAFAVILFTSVLKKDDASAPATTTATPAATAARPRRRAAIRPPPVLVGHPGRRPASAATPAPGQPRHLRRYPACRRRIAGRRPAALEGPARGRARRLRQGPDDRASGRRPEGTRRQAARAVHRQRLQRPRRRRGLRRQRPATSPSYARGSPRASRSAAPRRSSSSAPAS